MKKILLIISSFLICFYSNAGSLRLEKEITKIETYLDKKETLNLSVSKAPVKWHLLHMLQVINRVCESVQNSNPANYNPKFSGTWLIVSTTGRIPRGRVKAPKSVNPSYSISKEDILSELKKVKQNLAEWKELDKKNFFKHPVFNDLNKRKTNRFLKIHTRHHLRIIKDILNEG